MRVFDKNIKEGENYEGNKICGWLRLTRNPVVFGKKDRSPVFDKSLDCLLLGFCDESFLVRTVLKYYLRTPTKSYLLQHMHQPGTFSTIKTDHFFQVLLYILCKMFFSSAPPPKKFPLFFLTSNKYYYMLSFIVPLLFPSPMYIVFLIRHKCLESWDLLFVLSAPIPLRNTI